MISPLLAFHAPSNSLACSEVSFQHSPFLFSTYALSERSQSSLHATGLSLTLHTLSHLLTQWKCLHRCPTDIWSLTCQKQFSSSLCINLPLNLDTWSPLGRILEAKVGHKEGQRRAGQQLEAWKARVSREMSAGTLP